jgi:hypothetical protein
MKQLPSSEVDQLVKKSPPFCGTQTVKVFITPFTRDRHQFLSEPWQFSLRPQTRFPEYPFQVNFWLSSSFQRIHPSPRPCVTFRNMKMAIFWIFMNALIALMMDAQAPLKRR